MWLGFATVALFCAPDAGSPKSQDQLVGPLVDASVNATVSGAVPLRGVPENAATGLAGGGVVPPNVTTSSGGAAPSRLSKIALFVPALMIPSQIEPFPATLDGARAMSL